MIRARSILIRRGEIPDLPLDHRIVALEYKSPQARYQAQQDVQNTLIWLDSVRALGADAMAAVDQAAAARWLGRTLGVPGELIRDLPQFGEQRASAHDSAGSQAAVVAPAASSQAATPLTASSQAAAAATGTDAQRMPPGAKPGAVRVG